MYCTEHGIFGAFCLELRLLQHYLTLVETQLCCLEIAKRMELEAMMRRYHTAFFERGQEVAELESAFQRIADGEQRLKSRKEREEERERRNEERMRKRAEWEQRREETQKRRMERAKVAEQRAAEQQVMGLELEKVPGTFPEHKCIDILYHKKF